ncbi:Guanosine nucleotide diphosphate dissociation inhibitor 2 [Camellia lanceoleosa]|uniref:Guanosine nucleotide diphosphate dissociation inhibitor 2 n=1 Tax=Camellia lanceoleosa TaxID=1840588 RepID=A0ACC0FKZ7_9ERIC|nr:Guanosine nucleotide diphosphate dissociation inhibitor 2 [Camellia lanceoleosa]
MLDPFSSVISLGNKFLCFMGSQKVLGIHNNLEVLTNCQKTDTRTNANVFANNGANSQPPKSLGSSRDYNVDMIPKFMMANGGLVRALIHANVTKYLNFKAVDGKYIAFVTTEAETDNPEVELKPDIDLLGPVDEIFFETCDRFVPTNNHDVDNCFISMYAHFKTNLDDTRS